MRNAPHMVVATTWTEWTRRNSSQDWAEAEPEGHQGTEQQWQEAIARARDYNEALGWKKVLITRVK